MIRIAEEKDLERAAALAAELWPEHAAAALAEEFRALLNSGNGVLFLASEAGTPAMSAGIITFSSEVNSGSR